MDSIQKAFRDVADAKYKLYTLTNTNNKEVAVPVAAAPVATPSAPTPRKKKPVTLPEDWVCPGNLLTGEKCPTSCSVPHTSTKMFEGKRNALCSKCYSAFGKTMAQKKELTKKVAGESAPKKHKPASDDDEEEEVALPPHISDNEDEEVEEIN